MDPGWMVYWDLEDPVRGSMARWDSNVPSGAQLWNRQIGDTMLVYIKAKGHSSEAQGAGFLQGRAPQEPGGFTRNQSGSPFLCLGTVGTQKQGSCCFVKKCKIWPSECWLWNVCTSLWSLLSCQLEEIKKRAPCVLILTFPSIPHSALPQFLYL